MDILFVEDDILICKTVKAAWPMPGDSLHFVSTYAQSLNLIFGSELMRFDAVVLDIHLPDGDGLGILRTIRSNSSVPIVMISGSGTPETRAGIFDVGADDYLMKPFSVRELQARVSRLVSVRNSTRVDRQAAVFMIGRCECDLQKQQLRLDSESQTLTDAEARIIGYLHENAGRNCSKSAIYKHAFFRNYVPGDKTLDVYVGRIRKKLSALDTSGADFLMTARGAGYRLEQAVR
ncbi:response regulator transcription factor [Rhizobium sp. G21]|uniref:response regulator transcription factor n=1 Tax=Rhizobium sp. G21 TaxID=2758439 RepID=UPI001AEF3417|nr:response regulator transcription factor [Rhizobium sp. G21]